MLHKGCVICGDPNVHMHHVRKLRNRKQVPLCSTHHVRLHNNSLSNLERMLFKSGSQELAPRFVSSKARRGKEGLKYRFKMESRMN